MGTPHCGSDLAKWTRLFRDITNACTLGSIRTDLLKGLESKSAELAEIAVQFVQRGVRLPIVSVYEGRPLLAGTPVVSRTGFGNTKSTDRHRLLTALRQLLTL